MGRPGEFKRPQLPEGPLKDLTDALHELHLRAGRPTLSDLARALEGGVSRSRLHDALTSGRLPRWEVVDALVEVLGSRARGTAPEQELDRFHALWQRAVSEAGHLEPPTAPAPRSRLVPPPRAPSLNTSVADAISSHSNAAGMDISLYMSQALLSRIKDSQWQASIEDGYLSFLTGDFRPPKPQHQFPRETMAIVVARVSTQLRLAVAEYAQEHADDLEWVPTPKQVAVAWLMHTPPPSAGRLALVR
ncbi:hypothetical protein [Streptomyces sp. NPDC055210]